MINTNAQLLLQKLLDFYSPHFETQVDYTLAGYTLNAFTKHSNRAEKSIFGMKTNRIGSWSHEYGLYVCVEEFNAQAFLEAKKLIDLAETELIKPDDTHASSLVSIIILANSVDAGTAQQLKKFKHFRDYKSNGWFYTRFVVVDVNSQKIYCNNDGKPLMGLIKKAIEGKKLL